MNEIKIPKMRVIIPDGYKLMSLEQCEEPLQGKTWTMNDLRRWLGNKSSDWIKTNILFNPKFKNDIEGMINRNQIIRSKGHGSPWLFKASVFSKWLDEHWEQFNW